MHNIAKNGGGGGDDDNGYGSRIVLSDLCYTETFRNSPVRIVWSSFLLNGQCTFLFTVKTVSVVNLNVLDRRVEVSRCRQIDFFCAVWQELD